MCPAGANDRQSMSGLTVGTMIQVWTPLVRTKIVTPSRGSTQPALAGTSPPTRAATK